MDGDDIGEVLVHNKKKYYCKRNWDARSSNSIVFMRFDSVDENDEKFKQTQLYHYQNLVSKLEGFLEKCNIAHTPLHFQANSYLKNPFIKNIEKVSSLEVINNTGYDLTETDRKFLTNQVDAGSCNGCDLEIHALNNPYYDLERFGLKFVASPRHADVLLVTGPVTHNMAEALLRTWRATPDPKWVIAAGDCACNGGLFAGSYAVVGGVENVIPVDLKLAGCPPTPEALLAALRALLLRAAARTK